MSQRDSCSCYLTHKLLFFTSCYKAHVFPAQWPRLFCTTFVVHLSSIHIRLRGGGHFCIRLWTRLRNQFCDVLAYGIFDPFVEAISATLRKLGPQMGGSGSYTSTMHHGHTKPKGKPLGFVGMGEKVVGASWGPGLL